MPPPRLTGALRSFSNVSRHDDIIDEVYDLKAKRLKRRELFAREGLTWQKIVQFCTQHAEKAEQQAANQELKSILQAAKQIVGAEHGQDAIESAAVFLFQTFRDKDHVGHEETRAIKHMFGPFPSSAADASCGAVARVVAPLDESQVEDFVRAQGGGADPAGRGRPVLAAPFSDATSRSPTSATALSPRRLFSPGRRARRRRRRGWTSTAS